MYRVMVKLDSVVSVLLEGLSTCVLAGLNVSWSASKQSQRNLALLMSKDIHVEICTGAVVGCKVKQTHNSLATIRVTSLRVTGNSLLSPNALRQKKTAASSV